MKSSLVRTSQTHPLQIAELRSAAPGLIGITLCPGKTQDDAATGVWRRDLDLDLDVIRDWNAALIISLIEDHEFEALGVSKLGQEIAKRHIDWLHLPITDGASPSDEFEARWVDAVEGVKQRLQLGFNVLVHCKGGLGRAGTIAARLLIDLGTHPEHAIEQVRSHRPGAIETAAQESYVRRLKPTPASGRDRLAEGRKGRAVGALLGLAVGDALGTTAEFCARDSFPLIRGIQGGGPFRLAPGQWTDDTAMALALASSLLDCDRLDEADLMSRFLAWRDRGEYSCTGHCFDIGFTTNCAIDRWLRTGNPVAGDGAPHTAGNGSLMRLAPVAIRYWRERSAMRLAAARQSRTTHGAEEAVGACVAFSGMLADAICGKGILEVLNGWDGEYPERVHRVLAGSWRGARRDQIESSGYVVHSLEAALWCVGRTRSFADAVLLAANLGDDADTIAAITGQLAGAIYGASGIPAEWLECLAWRDRISSDAAALFSAGERAV